MDPNAFKSLETIPNAMFTLYSIALLSGDSDEVGGLSVTDRGADADDIRLLRDLQNVHHLGPDERDHRCDRGHHDRGDV